MIDLFLKKYKQNQIFIGILLVILISIPTFWNLLRPGYFKMHDDLQTIRVLEMTKCLKDGQIPCRWSPDMGYRYGYPQFNYYGPLPYYVMSLFNLLGVGLFDSVKIGFILPLLLGNIAMYFLAKKMFGQSGALIASTLYAYSPYRSSDIYSRGAMGETWAFIFFPLIFLFIKDTIDSPSVKKAIRLAFAIAGLFITHNISTLIFTPLALIWTISLLFGNHGVVMQRLWSTIKYLLISLLGSICLAAFFLLPVIFEKNLAHTESMIGGYFDYRAHFVTFKQLFLTSFWGYGSSEIGPTDDLSFFISPIVILIVSSSVFLFINKLFNKYIKSSDTSFIIFVFLGLFATFMSHEKSSFIWKMLPFLKYLQFPWRFLVLSNFFFALSCGYFLQNANLKMAKYIIFSIISVTFLLSVSFFRPNSWFNYIENEKLSGYLWDKQMTISIFDYLPIYAPTPPNAPAPIYPISNNRYSYIENFKKGTNWLSFEYVSTSSSTLNLNLLQFPNWKISDNKIRIFPSVNDRGLITLNLSEGSHLITVKLINSKVRLIGNLLTLLSLPLGLYILFKRNQDA